MGDDLVVLVKESDSSAKIGHEEDVFVGVDIGGEDKAIEGFEMLALQ